MPCAPDPGGRNLATTELPYRVPYVENEYDVLAWGFRPSRFHYIRSRGKSTARGALGPKEISAKTDRSQRTGEAQPSDAVSMLLLLFRRNSFWSYCLRGLVSSHFPPPSPRSFFYLC
jgi:hypothetical protein